MNISKFDLYMALYERYVLERNDYNVITDCSNENFDLVYDEVLVLILEASSEIGLPGYQPSWLDRLADVETSEVPIWASLLGEYINKRSRRYYVSKKVISDQRMRHFWQLTDFSARVKNRNSRVVFNPGFPLIRVDTNLLPFSSLVKFKRWSAPRGNLWSKIEAAKAWVEDSKSHSGCINVILDAGLNAFGFKGDDSSIKALIKGLRETGAYNNPTTDELIEQLEEQLMIYPGEVFEKAVERIWTVNLDHGKRF